MGEHCRLASQPLRAPSAPCPPAPRTGGGNEGWETDEGGGVGGEDACSWIGTVWHHMHRAYAASRAYTVHGMRYGMYATPDRS